MSITNTIKGIGLGSKPPENNDAESIGYVVGAILAFPISVFFFEYSLYTLTHKDIYWGLDVLACIIIWLTGTKTTLKLNTLIWSACFISRVCLSYPTPWINL